MMLDSGSQYIAIQMSMLLNPMFTLKNILYFIVAWRLQIPSEDGLYSIKEKDYGSR